MFRKLQIANRLPNRYFPKLVVGCPCLFSVSLGKPVMPRRNWKQWLWKILEIKQGYNGQYRFQYGEEIWHYLIRLLHVSVTMTTLSECRAVVILLLLGLLLHSRPKLITLRTFITFRVIYYIWGLNKACAWTSVISAGKCDNRRHFTTSVRETVVVAETSYQMSEVLSFCDREWT